MDESGEEVQRQFSLGARAYGTGGTEWHRRYAERLVELTRLGPGMSVIDAGCGNGLATFAAARAVGPDGAVLGVDLSDEMIEAARHRAASEGVSNVSFRRSDAASLPETADASVDAVICSSALIYMALPQALLEWHRVVRPGRLVVFSTMRDDSPRISALFRDCAREHGVEIGNPNAVLGRPERCRAMLVECGFSDVHVVAESVSIAPLQREGLWEQQASAGVHRAMRDVPERIRAEIRNEFAQRVTDDDLREPMHVLYALARRPVSR